MEERLFMCDECGEKFLLPHEGEVSSGFGICNKCFQNLSKIQEEIKK